MAMDNMLVWNVWCLNSVAHRNAVQDLITSKRISLVCLQKTKLHVITITDFDIIQTLGTGFDYVFLLVVQTRGGNLLAWRTSAWVVGGHSARSYSLSAKIRLTSGSPECWLTTI
jgi:hypothetical protein